MLCIVAWESWIVVTILVSEPLIRVTSVVLIAMFVLVLIVRLTSVAVRVGVSLMLLLTMLI